MKHFVQQVVQDTMARLVEVGVLPPGETPTYTIESPRDPSHGDWATNAALVLAKVARKSPAILAEALVANLVDTRGIIERAVKAGPGFVNFTLRAEAFGAVARDILLQGERFGRRPSGSTGRRIHVELVSANPTGPLHIGHARGAFVADAIARLQRAAGHEVLGEYYVNDYGKQVETLGRTVYRRYRELSGREESNEPVAYPGDYVRDIAKDLHKEVGETLLDAPESLWLPKCIEFGVAACLTHIRATLGRAGIVPDAFFSERHLHESGAVTGIVERYRELGATYEAAEAESPDGETKVRSAESKAAVHAHEQKGGLFLRTATFERDGKLVVRDEEDRIILRHDGTPVYLTADLAYHRSKFERGYDLAIDVFGADHAGHVTRLHSGMTILGIDAQRLACVLVQMVRITRGDTEVKLSKRRGEIYELDDLLSEVGADACRFIFLSRTSNAQFDFDLDVVQRRTKDNPVYYMQYGYARCASILSRAYERGSPFRDLSELQDSELAHLRSPQERELLKRLSMFPEVVEGAAERLEPHHVLYYCRELIAEFHSYYTGTKDDPIIGTDRSRTQGRLALVAALKQILSTAFSILGISAPEHMDAPDDELAA